MRLLGWNIDGFGVFCDARLGEPGLGPGFNLFVGPNEAGKTTLLDFIRYTLFGYPSGNRRLPRREPLRGGTHGGTLIYEADGRTLRLHRRPGTRDDLRLTDADANPLTRDDHARHLGHVTEEVFRNIFAFSLAELQEAATLESGDVRDLIFAASIGRAASKVRRVQEHLQARANLLFRDGARAGSQNPPRVIKWAAELDALERELDTARTVSKDVAKYHSQLAELQEREQSLRAEIDQLAAESQSLDRLIRGWEPWVKRCRAEEAIAGLGDISRFPPNGEPTWLELKHNVEEAARRQREAQSEIEEHETKLRNLPVEFPLLELADEAKELAEQKASYNTAVLRLRDEKHEAEKLQQNWSQLAEELGPDWSADVVRSFDVSLLQEDQLRSRVAGLQGGHKDFEEKAVEAQRLGREANELVRQCGAKRNELHELARQGPLPTPEQVEEQAEAMANFRQAIVDRLVIGGELERANDHYDQVRLFFTRHGTPAPTMPAWLKPALLTAVLLAVIASVGLFAVSQATAGAICFGFAIVLGVIWWLVHSLPTRVGVPAEPAPELREAEERLARQQERLTRHDLDWRDKAAAAELSWPASEHELIAWQGRIEAACRGLERHGALSKEEKNLTEREQEKNAELHTAQNAIALARERLDQLTKEWSQFLRDRRVSENINPETAIAVFSSVKAGARLLRSSAEQREREADYERQAGMYLDRLRGFLAHAGRTLGNKLEETFAQLTAVQKEIENQRAKKRLRGELEDQLDASRGKLDPHRAAADEARAASDEFLRKAGVTTEEEWLDLASRATKHREEQHGIDRTDAALVAIFGQDGPPGELREAWLSGSRPDWELKKQQADEERRTKISERDQLLQDIRSLDDQIKGQLQSDVVATKQLLAETRREDIRKALREWLRLAIAQEMLRSTRERFEQANQSPALEEASRLFHIISGGRYHRIVVPLDEDKPKLTVMGPTGEPLAATNLSRGTLEQLYLCVRLGYLRHFQQQQGIQLPLLMDDVTVNFDPERLAQTVQVLVECCHAGQQVLFFTCHPQLADLAPPNARVFRICHFALEYVPFGLGDAESQRIVSLVSNTT